MNQTFSLFVSVSLVCATALASCGPRGPAAPPSAGSVRLTDWLGREVALAAPARRIISLAPSNTEIVFALGAGDRLVGRDAYSDYPPEAIDVPSLGNLYPKVEAESVVLLEPDLVLAAGMTSPDDVKGLARLGLTVYSTSIATRLEDIYADIAAIGRLTGQSLASERLVAELAQRVDAIRARTAAVSSRPRVLYEIDATDPAKPWTAGPGSFIDELIRLAGGENVARAGAGKYFQISLEELVTQDPQVIILGSSTYGGQTPELVGRRSGWGGMTAVKTGAVHPFDDKLVSRPGPRVVIGLEVLARWIQPELFP